MALADWLRAQREQRQWSQAELARRARLSSVFINLIEQGKRPRPSGATLQALAAALEVEVSAVYAALTPLPPAGEGLADPRLADWPPDVLARLRDLYPDMSAADLETAVDLGVEAVRRIKDRRQRPRRQVGQRGHRPAAPGQEGGPAPEGGELPAPGRC